MTKRENSEKRFDINRSLSKGPVKFDVVSRFIRLPDDREVRLSRSLALVFGATVPGVKLPEPILTERVNQRANLFFDLERPEREAKGLVTKGRAEKIEFYTRQHVAVTMQKLRQILGPWKNEVLPKTTALKSAKK